MKRSILVLFTILVHFAYSQNSSITLSGKYGNLNFKVSKSRDIEKLLGKPEIVSRGSVHANIGSCIFTTFTIYQYESAGVYITCSRVTAKKASSKNQIFSKIEFDERSGIILNNKLECGKSIKRDVESLFTLQETDKKGEYLYSIKNHTTPSCIYFTFDEGLILRKVSIY